MDPVVVQLFSDKLTYAADKRKRFSTRLKNV